MAKLPFNPENLELEEITGEPAISPESLTPEAIRLRFTNPPEWIPEIQAEKPLKPAPYWPVPASVLIPMVDREDELHVLMTRRTDHLHHHPGQISFPGGRADEEDASAVDTALRETEEEIGLERQHIEVIGTLPDHIIATGYQVKPFVSIVQPRFELVPDPFEVAEVMEIPLSHLMNGQHHQRRSGEFPRLGHRTFYAIPYQHHFIWGATAAMLRNLFHFLRA